MGHFTRRATGSEPALNPPLHLNQPAGHSTFLNSRARPLGTLVATQLTES
jgi:hypothetical protein